MSHKGLYRNVIKRLLDIILSATALVALSPLLMVTTLLVRIKLGKPAVFKQARPGLKEKIFNLYKFRSMTNEVGEDGRLLPDAQRLTKFGRFLRSSSLDELLELVNILRGDMSIVGPRPLSIYYLPHYPANLRRRHDVRPGLTGLAQVNGRNNLPWDERFELDIRYVDNVSFGLDLKIILDTALKVLKRADVSVRGTSQVKDYGPYCILKEERNGGRKVENMTYSEIGSYFWLDGKENSPAPGKADWLPAAEDSAFTFSGRNAIYLAIRDAMEEHDIRRVYVPSYCCVSMLQSFIDLGLKTEFYKVAHSDGAFTYQIPDADEHSAVLIMSYFGLDTSAAHEVIAKLHERGAVVIEDITHSLLCETPASELSDYIVASLRKWFAIPTGGWTGKTQGKLSFRPDMDSNHAVEEKIAGMREKYDYLTGKIDSKENFLLTQAKFDNDLIHVDRMLKIDDMSLKLTEGADISSVRETRRKNALALLSYLKDLDGSVMELPEMDPDKDTPLFLPVFMNTEDRDELRRYLVSRGMYCTVHWPEVMGAPAGVRENELSLICDQRYTDGDMKAIADAVHDWVAQKGSEAQ